MADFRRGDLRSVHVRRAGLLLAQGAGAVQNREIKAQSQQVVGTTGLL